MKIHKEKRNDLMGRTEVQLIILSEKNPSFIEASKTISEKFKSPEENIMIENVKGKFGRSTFLIQASIYDSKELKDESFRRLIKPKKAAAPAA